ncbi:hypothetical protein PTT_03574 [Pyrenophora teres f. teres 0-1]|uniref:Uncharacterized protein n=1 Tax=Pyrenophora teres f. teres (strain 0-1) TaxID=861557 RepID=E3RE15_PYRTT|nr:hypothetical protein PTT_03574 [Pyrenophora teres f. teres 0-1]
MSVSRNMNESARDSAQEGAPTKGDGLPAAEKRVPRNKVLAALIQQRYRESKKPELFSDDEDTSPNESRKVAKQNSGGHQPDMSMVVDKHEVAEQANDGAVEMLDHQFDALFDG